MDTVKSKLGTKNLKVSLPDGTIVYHAVYDNGSNEAFVIHVKEVLSFCKWKNYYKFYEKAAKTKEDCSLQFNAAQKKSNNAIADPTTTPERAKALNKSLELATAGVVVAEKTVLKRGKAFFSLYKTLLGENSQVKWSRIVDTQIRVIPWTDLQGNVQNIACVHSVDSFRECVKFHLLLVFAYDTAEHQKYYISHYLKKPRKIPLRNFSDRIEMLNSYIPYLPRLIDSLQGANMKKATALDEPELAQLLLQLVPQCHDIGHMFY